MVGVVEVVREHYPDPTDAKGRFGMVDFKIVEALPEPVTLAQVKADGRLDELALIRQSRLSVMPVDKQAWDIICGLGGLKK